MLQGCPTSPLLDPQVDELSDDEQVIQLGFVIPEDEDYDDEEEPAFSTKLGGYPAWLCPDSAPKAEDISCGLCQKPMNFLMQIYTPEDHPPQAYHRALYIFICSSGSCVSKSRSQSIKAIRTQLPRDNAYYEPQELSTLQDSNSKDTDDEKWSLKDTVDVEGKRCWVCGLFSSTRCSKCHKAQYCGRNHQLRDWNLGNHRNTCLSGPSPPDFNATPLSGYPPRYIECENEKSGEEMARDEMKKVEGLMEQVSISNDGGDKQLVVPGDEAYENTKVEVDQAFLAFQRRIDYDPSQILRYARTNYGDDNVEPLWVSDIGKPAPTAILPCQICGSTRVFEMQILPQMLNFLPIDHSNPVALDWGTYIVYTCPENCSPSAEDMASCPDVLMGGGPSGKQSVYMSEVVWHQDFSSHGIGENIRKNHFS
ncbi:hypothetical protein DSO57_1022095 [Entomophthora muscae]|uniref:Uncharacterized protein n=1 Tax=Entomophthora muscae TaxID=34485 RepID=A0ACC2T3G6_9FUNG|nr:hypothetical protein DSO57_1022095 [Entomophthora muscae]